MFKQEMRNAGVTEEEIDYGLKFCSPLGHDFFEGMTNPEIKEMVKEYLETRTPESVDCIVKDMNKDDYEYGRAKKNITIYKSELKKIGIAGEELFWLLDDCLKRYTFFAKLENPEEYAKKRHMIILKIAKRGIIF